MGSSDSKPEENNDTQINGILNGNQINNGQIIQKIDSDLVKENWLLIIIIVLKSIHIAIILVKWFTKYVRKQHQRDQELKQIIIERNRQS